MISFEIEVDGFVVESAGEMEDSVDSIEIIPLIVNRKGSQRNIIDDLKRFDELEIGDILLYQLQLEADDGSQAN